MKRWSPLRYIRNYKFNSLFLKNFILIEIIVFLPMVMVCVACYLYFQDAYLKEIRKAAQGTVYRLQETTDTVLTNIRLAGIHLCQDENLLDFLDYPSNIKYDFEKMRNVVELRNTLTQYTNEYLQSVYVYAETSGYIVTGSGAKSRKLARDTSWIPLYEEAVKRGSTEWSRIRVDEDEWERSYPCISIALFLPYSGSQTCKGVLILNMSSAWLDNLLAVSGDDFYDFYIVDEDGRVVYNSDENKIGRNAEEYMALPLSQIGEEGGVTAGGRYLVNCRKSDNGRWNYVYMTDLNSYNARRDRLALTLLLTGLLLLFLSIAVSYMVSVRVFLPVKSVIEMLEDPKKLYDLSDGQEGRGELKFIAASFLETFKKEEQNQRELTRYITSLKETQIALLQAQINPHFLFNTLQSISFMAIAFTRTDNTVTRAVDMLSSMMRYMMEVDYNTVTVEKELEYSRAYIGLEQLRFGEKLKVDWEIDPQLETCQIAKVTLQPILENSIKHGFKNMKEEGQIVVCGRREEEDCVFTVSDNGIGQTEEWIDAKNEELGKSMTLTGRRIGIQNVNQRIRMIFGMNYGLNIRKMEKGFCVEIRIPAVSGEDKSR